MLLPFAWEGVTLHATGATKLRVRITRPAENTLSVEVADPHGVPVASVRSLVLRPLSPEQLLGAVRSQGGGQPLFGIDWAPLSLPAARDGDGSGSLTHRQLTVADGG